MKKIYMIAGPNGAGKTTLSYTILPDIFNCYEFVNADEIAKGISPFQPEKAGVRAGRLMLKRIQELIEQEESFALETTLSTRSYNQLVKKAQSKGYEVILLFLALDTKQLAVNRVKIRVEEGGHNIPKEVIERRFDKGLYNLFKLYMSVVDQWLLVENSTENFEFIAEGSKGEVIVRSEKLWSNLKKRYDGN